MCHTASFRFGIAVRYPGKLEIYVGSGLMGIDSVKERVSAGDDLYFEPGGCAVNCQFCLTAKLGIIKRNLTAGEIAGQVARC
jgi:hypothetical protein